MEEAKGSLVLNIFDGKPQREHGPRSPRSKRRFCFRGFPTFGSRLCCCSSDKADRAAVQCAASAFFEVSLSGGSCCTVFLNRPCSVLPARLGFCDICKQHRTCALVLSSAGKSGREAERFLEPLPIGAHGHGS